MSLPESLRNRIVGHGDEKPEDLLANPKNWRRHPKHQEEALEGVLARVGWVQSVIVNKRTGLLVDGHLRVEVAKRRKEATLPVVYVDLSEDEEALILATLDPLAAMADTDREQLAGLLQTLEVQDPALQAMLDGLSLDDAAASLPKDYLSLSERFVVPPLSVLDTRQGYWRERRQAWLAHGIESEVGREAELVFSSSAQPPEVYEAKNAYEAKLGREVGWSEYFEACPDARRQPGTSIFDPVLCEIAYRWFCPPGGTVLDPFAGGSVRGVVAGLLGRNYQGLELRAGQVEANRSQAATIFSEHPGKPAPAWAITDSLLMDEVLSADFRAHLIFSCPPYADLEVYSDDPADLSNKEYPQFLDLYRGIIAKAVARLEPDGFIVWVVGEVRGKDGRNLGFVPDTIRAFEDAGAVFYNEAILVNQVASAAVRAARTFESARKLCKVHQNVLVFLKGNAKRATSAVGAVECGSVQEASE